MLFSGSLGDKGTQDVNLISIPSIIFGSKIKKGHSGFKVLCQWKLIGQLQDEKEMAN